MGAILTKELSASAFRTEAKVQGLTGKKRTEYVNTKLAANNCIFHLNIDGNDMIVRKDKVTDSGLVKMTAGLASAEGLALIGQKPVLTEAEKLEREIAKAKSRIERLELKRI